MSDSINLSTSIAAKRAETQASNSNTTAGAKEKSKSGSVFGEKLTDEEIAKSYNESDTLKKDGKISQNEWLAKFVDGELFAGAEEKGPKSSGNIIEIFLKAFNKADKNKDGFLNIDEYTSVIDNIDSTLEALKEELPED